MLSGIGPADHLTSLGIKVGGFIEMGVLFEHPVLTYLTFSITQVEEDLPVGKNLHDHLTTSIGPFILNKEYKNKLLIKFNTR